MAEGNKPIRLSKIAREFNIGISTIADFLSKKGYAIEAKPNSKIQPDMYELLVNEFQSEKAVKQESLKIGIDYSSHETISIDDEVIGKPEQEQEFEPEEFIIKNIAGSFKEEIIAEDQKTPEEDIKEIVAEKIEKEEVKPEITTEDTAISIDKPEVKEELKKETVKPEEKVSVPEPSEKEKTKTEPLEEKPQE